MTTLDQILNITSVYLDDTLDYQKLSAASKQFKQLLIQLAGNDFQDRKSQEDIHTDSGKAIGPLWAALCLDDLMRTRQFVRGIHAAIAEKLNSSSEQLHILYAGTGPYATLLLPLIGRFPKEKIRYTFLEINPLTFEVMQHVVSGAGLADYDITMTLADATTYGLQADNMPDIIISETMQRNLGNEHQVPIFLNLLSQAKPDTIFIPSKIALQIGLKKSGYPHDGKENYYQPLNKVVEVSREAMQELINDRSRANGDLTLSETKTSIAVEAQQEFENIMLFTDIEVYKNTHIKVNESSLTLPKKLADLPKDKNQVITIHSRYKISAKPGLEYEIEYS